MTATAPELELTARALVAPGKGILAADESDGTIKKRFDSIDVESTEDNRRAYRELLFTTEGVEDYISGVILYDETIRQKASDGTPFPELLASKGVIPGIKVDLGAKPLALAAERDDHRRARRAARPARGVPRARRALREVARDLLDRRSPSERVLRLDERARARALRGALPGGRHRPDRRAGGAAGRHAHDRRVGEGDGSRAPGGLHGAARPAGRLPRNAAQAEHGHVRLRARRTARASTRSPSGRSTSSTATSPRRCRGSSSSPAASRTRTRPRTSTR